MVRVITVSREFGSGGESIARIVARMLGWRLVDNQLVEEIARRANVDPEIATRCDETLDSWFHRLLRALWHGGFEGSVAQTDYRAFDAEDMARLWNSVIREAAAIGNCVIVGRGGQCLLQDRTDAFHVAVYAPMEEKIRRMRQRFPNVDDIQALAVETDRMRAAYIRHHFDQDWTDRHLYHLMICSTIGLERAADAIVCAAGVGETEEPEDGS